MRTRLLLLAMLFYAGTHQLFAQQNGELVSAIPKQVIPPEALELIIGSQFDEEARDFLLALAGIQYAVAEFEVNYYTRFPDGSTGIASGQVTIPIIPGAPAVKLPLASYLHGTITANREAPSVGSQLPFVTSTESIIGWTLASSGYVAASPDYLGFGASAQTVAVHPYLDAKTEASASIDLLRATRQLVERLPLLAGQLANFGLNLSNIGLNDQVFLTGYSQGGHSVIATQKTIERHYRSEFKLETVVGGSGPYDLPGVQRDFVLDNPDYSNPAFLPYFILGQREVRRDVEIFPLEKIFTDPTIEQLFISKLNSVGDINAELEKIGPQWRDSFTDPFLNSVENDFFNPVNNALRANRLTNFRPKTNTWLLFCTEDEQVDFRNSLVAWFNYFIRGAGLRVKAATLGPQTHGECAPFAILTAKLLFDLRKETSGLGASARQMAEAPPSHLDPEQYQRIQDIVNNHNLPDLEQWLAEAGLHDLRNQLLYGDGLRPLALYPNPVKDYALLDHSRIESPIQAVAVFDLAGKEVRQVSPGEDGVMVIDRTGLSAGQYVVKVVADKTYRLQMLVE